MFKKHLKLYLGLFNIYQKLYVFIKYIHHIVNEINLICIKIIIGILLVQWYGRIFLVRNDNANITESEYLF